MFRLKIHRLKNGNEHLFIQEEMALSHTYAQRAYNCLLTPRRVMLHLWNDEPVYVRIIRKRCILRAAKRNVHAKSKDNRLINAISRIFEIESDGKEENKIRNNITLDTHALTSHIALVFPSNVFPI